MRRNDGKYNTASPDRYLLLKDFACIEKRLIVEVDGGYHSEYEQIKKDEFRTERLNRMGFSVIRFSNEEILGNIFGVINQIKNKLNE